MHFTALYPTVLRSLSQVSMSRYLIGMFGLLLLVNRDGLPSSTQILIACPASGRTDHNAQTVVPTLPYDLFWALKDCVSLWSPWSHAARCTVCPSTHWRLPMALCASLPSHLSSLSSACSGDHAKSSDVRWENQLTDRVCSHEPPCLRFPKALSGTTCPFQQLPTLPLASRFPHNHPSLYSLPIPYPPFHPYRSAWSWYCTYSWQ